MFDEHRFRKYGTNPTRSGQSSKSNDEMNEKNDQIARLVGQCHFIQDNYKQAGEAL